MNYTFHIFEQHCFSGHVTGHINNRPNQHHFNLESKGFYLSNWINH